MLYVYRFGNSKADGSARLSALLGGKGAGLAEMTNLGISVPPGFTINTKVCVQYLKTGKYPKKLLNEVKQGMKFIEQITGRKFGSAENPLLLSIRSGAKASMPGMLDSVLNLGLNDSTVDGLAKQTKNRRFALDSYRRFLEMFSEVVFDLPIEEFEKIFDTEKNRQQFKLDSDLTENTLEYIIRHYKIKVLELTGKSFPEDPFDQLWMAITAVFESWNNPRAQEYRRIYKIPKDWGTAVNVQAMVFGNMGETSATGVVFTRNPANGENEPYGEFLLNAQGEDIVAGVRTPKPIEWLEQTHPKNYAQLLRILKKLENHYRDMSDVEFTIENNRLWILQARRGKRTPRAAVKIAYDMHAQGMIDKAQAIMRISAKDIEALLHPMISEKEKITPLVKGIPASPGAISGQAIFSTGKAIKLGRKGIKVILVRTKTSAEDVGGMAHSVGFLTATGGMTSHAAVVARGMGKPCIVGCEEIKIDESGQKAMFGDLEIKQGMKITIDGTSGAVYSGELKTQEPELSQEFKTILQWTDQIKTLQIRTNADTPQDALVARKFGAQGIGLCRTEHMFFGAKRIWPMREMILASTSEQRARALSKLLPFQKQDFIGIFKAMAGLPVTIRTLDPPLHEFLPKDEKQIASLARRIKLPVEKVKQRINLLKEDNPMLGFRGCRLGITYPEITEMQAQAIFEAACELTRQGVKVLPEIMIPLVGTQAEFVHQEKIVERVASLMMAKYQIKISYTIGTMIEVPRAALVANEIAREADFFSFGTNDLTQTVFGYSRDDAGKFLNQYLDKKILESNPFETLDTNGVGQMIKMAVRLGRKSKSNLKIGICGEHGGDADSIDFFHKIGLDYISSSPYRIIGARIAAAQAVLKYKKYTPH
ncbi:MAG: pyruvate, phosphate dikinase [Candidatus Latescibacteria bacterium]|nr:pyruvate, phosphate dikinase [Candidatus Latescibacterota bacterium]